MVATKESHDGNGTLPRWKHCGDGIYLDSRTGHYYERPKINSRRTWRVLKQRTLKLAREELAARRIDSARASYGMAKNPYAIKPRTAGELLEAYESAGCPDRRMEPRKADALRFEVRRLGILKSFWASRMASDLKYADCISYFAARKKQIKKHGGRSVDLELMTLNNVLTWSVHTGKLDANPLGTRPKFRPKVIHHCREFMPANAAELHQIAATFFQQRKSEALGWQVLLQAMTGARTSEVLRLRWDATAHAAGHIEGDWLWLARSKGGVNPFCQMHPALDHALKALKAWRKKRYPRSPWFIPGKLKSQPLGPAALAHAMRRLSQPKRTPHGLRAYYVTVRRSQGISDAQIAAEIGDKTGPSIIAQVYGDIPPNWQGSAKLDWMVKKPAWTVIKYR